MELISKEEVEKILEEQKYKLKPEKRKIKWFSIFWLFSYILGFLMFLFFFFLGLFKGELTLAFWIEIHYHYEKSGIIEAIFLSVLYINFFIGLFMYPFGLLYLKYYLIYHKKIKYDTDKIKLSESEITKCIALGFYVLLTFIIFKTAIIEFLRNCPWEVWSGVLLLIFLLISVIFTIIMLSKNKN